jgi:hypothetical protein
VRHYNLYSIRKKNSILDLNLKIHVSRFKFRIIFFFGGSKLLMPILSFLLYGDFFPFFQLTSFVCDQITLNWSRASHLSYMLRAYTLGVCLDNGK